MPVPPGNPSGAPEAPTTADERALMDRVPKRLRIGSGWVVPDSGGLFSVADPSTGVTLAEVADATPEDGIAALTAAHGAQAAWAATAPRERSDILVRAYQAVKARVDDLSLLITLEMGKPLADSRWEVAYAADFLRWYAEEAVRIEGRYLVSPSGTGRILTLQQPVGPALLITPWNLPLAMVTRKIGAALAAGCTIILKPAEQTPLTALALTEILLQAGIPDHGVINTLTTSSPGPLVAALMTDRRLRKVSFTGSTEVGRALIAQSASQVLRISLELGGNAPFIVFEDADLNQAADGAMLAKMRTNGEACTAANRFYVARRAAPKFIDLLADRFRNIRVGRGTDLAVDAGPLIDASAQDRLDGLIADATSRGSHILVGGARLDRPGYFYSPTLLTDVGPGSQLLDQELFGPIAPVCIFDNESEVVAAANGTWYGLAAYLYTNDLNRALRVSESLETGMVALNQGTVANAAAPFGGIKHSGYGREGGQEGLQDYLQTKYLAIGMD